MGKSLASDFKGHVREIFRRLDATLSESGAKLADSVTMIAVVTDIRYGEQFTRVRKEIFGDNFPASELIIVTAPEELKSCWKFKASR
ncbi:MAG: RidA family protein [Proteobacteria bacterium]|nr:RidA family protein [Pseudomonadota bacterium]